LSPAVALHALGWSTFCRWQDAGADGAAEIMGYNNKRGQRNKTGRFDEQNDLLCPTKRPVLFCCESLSFRLKHQKYLRFLLYCPRFFVTLAMPKVLALGSRSEKNPSFSFVLRSLFRNFGSANLKL